jgi:hypothetical protein
MALSTNRGKIMEERIGNYIIVIDNDELYSDNSEDNQIRYEHIYKTKNDEKAVSKHSITIKTDTKDITNAILIGTSGATGIHKNSYYIQNNLINICVSNFIFCLSIPELNLIWKTEIDCATAFQIFKMHEDFIIHGEIEISRINQNGKIIWQHSGSDIFVLPNGKEGFKIQGDIIQAESWDGRKYIFKYNGAIV